MPGEKTAIEQALQSADDVDDEFEQLDLIGAPETASSQAIVKRRAKDGSNRGRTPGAKNRRTLAMIDVLQTRYSSPLEVLAQIATARVDELAAKLGCTKTAALQEKRLAAVAMLPFWHQKQPLAIDVTKRSVVYLKIEPLDAAQSDAAEHDGIGFSFRVAQTIDGSAKVIEGDDERTDDQA